MKRLGEIILLLALLALTVLVRVHNHEDVFHDGRIFFAEGDCYSRMTRARMVCEGQPVIRHHDFENWPQGTTPHTTAPLDWIIAGLRGVCGLFSPLPLDLAGALVSPLLALLTAAWLWWWCGRMRLPFRAVVLLFFALSPILVHGTKLGRPDHQSLLLLLLAVAVAAEFALAEKGMPARLARRWAIAAGAAWGVAMWVSLYEPLVVFAGAVGRHVIFNRSALLAHAVRGRWFALGGVFVLALLIDGWRLSMPDATLREYFARWSEDIGELKHLSLGGALVWHWLGAFWVLAPVTLFFAARMDKRAWSILLLIVVMLGLSMWQLRWGYFLALAVAMSLPWQLGALRNAWLAWGAALVAMLPLGIVWRQSLLLSEDERIQRDEVRMIHEEFRNIAELIRGGGSRPFIAPWWYSPEIAYWSGQPGVAGTSHQSLPGIVDSARFFLAETPEEAAAIVKARGVRFIIVHDIPIDADGERQYPAVNNAASILGRDVPEKAFGWLLAEHGRNAPPWLRLVTNEERGLVYQMARQQGQKVQNTSVQMWLKQYLKLYEVLPDKL